MGRAHETAPSARAAADSTAALDAGDDAPAAATDEGDFEADASAFFDDYPVPQTGETFHPGDPAVGSADDELVTVLPASAEDVEDVAADGDAPFTEAETLLPPAPYTEEDTAGGATAAEAEERLDEVSLDDFMLPELHVTRLVTRSVPM